MKTPHAGVGSYPFASQCRNANPATFFWIRTEYRGHQILVHLLLTCLARSISLTGVLMIEIWWLVPVFFLNKNGIAIRHFEARQLKLQSICWNLSIYNFCKHFVYSTWHSLIWHSIASWWQKWCGLPCSWCAQHCIYLFFLWSWGMWSWENTLWSTPKRLVCKQLVFCVIASHG